MTGPKNFALEEPASSEVCARAIGLTNIVKIVISKTTVLKPFHVIPPRFQVSIDVCLRSNKEVYLSVRLSHGSSDKTEGNSIYFRIKNSLIYNSCL